MSQEVRKETLTLLARQLAIWQGQVWERLAEKQRAGLLTLAGNLLATVERQARLNWNKEC